MRLTPGAAVLRFKQVFGHGARVAWYRDIVRPRILKTTPISDTSDRQCEVHALTSRYDWLNLIWGLKTFYLASGRHYALCIHEDGSLNEAQISQIAHHFPEARIIRRSEADARMDKELSHFPRSAHFRKTNLLAPKLFDFTTFLDSERMILFDSDLLFFAEPTAFLEKVEDPAYQLNAFNSDFGDAYTVTPEIVRAVAGVNLISRINSGFGLVHRKSMRWDWTEEFLALPGVLDGHFWRIEQTMIALCSSRYGAELLPAEYDLTLEPGVLGRCFRHYVGAIRHMLYGEGIPQVLNSGLVRL